MTIIRVVDKGGEELVSEMEVDHIPSVGDTFWRKTAGPFRVLEREWRFPADYNDLGHRVTLVVERIETHN